MQIVVVYCDDDDDDDGDADAMRRSLDYMYRYGTLSHMINSNITQYSLRYMYFMIYIQIRHERRTDEKRKLTQKKIGLRP
jgi:hypothetical protein